MSDATPSPRTHYGGLTVGIRSHRRCRGCCRGIWPPDCRSYPVAIEIHPFLFVPNAKHPERIVRKDWAFSETNRRLEIFASGYKPVYLSEPTLEHTEVLLPFTAAEAVAMAQFLDRQIGTPQLRSSWLSDNIYGLMFGHDKTATLHTLQQWLNPDEQPATPPTDRTVLVHRANEPLPTHVSYGAGELAMLFLLSIPVGPEAAARAAEKHMHTRTPQEVVDLLCEWHHTQPEHALNCGDCHHFRHGTPNHTAMQLQRRTSTPLPVESVSVAPAFTLLEEDTVDGDEEKAVV